MSLLAMCQPNILYGGPGGSRTRVQNTFLFISYSNNSYLSSNTKGLPQCGQYNFRGRHASMVAILNHPRHSEQVKWYMVSFSTFKLMPHSKHAADHGSYHDQIAFTCDHYRFIKIWIILPCFRRKL